MLSRKITQGLILAVALGVTLVLIVGVWKGTVQKERREQNATRADDPTGGEMNLSDMEYTEMQEGKRLWTLHASDAVYYQDEQKSLLTTVHITFYLRDGTEAQVVSGHGVLHAGTKNIELMDDVGANLPQGYKMTSDKAFYEDSKQVIFADAPVHVTGPDGEVTGDRWEYRVKDQSAALQGNVKGILNSFQDQVNTITKAKK